MNCLDESAFKDLDSIPDLKTNQYPMTKTVRLSKEDYRRLELLRGKGKNINEFMRKAVHVALELVFGTIENKDAK